MKVLVVGAGSGGLADYGQVWLCLPSPALRGPWLGEFLAHPSEATVVLLSAALGGRALVLEHVPAGRVPGGSSSFSTKPG